MPLGGGDVLEKVAIIFMYTSIVQSGSTRFLCVKIQRVLARASEPYWDAIVRLEKLNNPLCDGAHSQTADILLRDHQINKAATNQQG